MFSFYFCFPLLSARDCQRVFYLIDVLIVEILAYLEIFLKFLYELPEQPNIYISDVIEEKRHEIPFTAFESVKKVAGRKRTCLIKTRYFASNDHVVCLYGNFLSAWENTGADPSKGYANDRINALRAGFDLRFQSASSDLSTRQKTWLNRDSNSAGHGQWLLFWKNSVNLHLSFLSVMMERCDLGCWKVWFQCKQVLGAIHVSANEGVWIVIRLVTTRTLKSLKCRRTLEIGAYETSISQIKYKNNSYVNHHPVHFFDHHLISLF